MNLNRAAVFIGCLLAFAPLPAIAQQADHPAIPAAPAAAAPDKPDLPNIPGLPSGAAVDQALPDMPEIVNFHADLPSFGTVTVEKGPIDPEKTARQDRLVLRRTKDATPETVFESKGRRLVAVKSALFTNQTTPDLLLALDPGGSGGFIEFVLIGASGTKLIPLWEPEGIKGGAATFDKVDGKTVLLIDSLSLPPVSSQAAKVSTVYSWENGAVVEGKAIVTPMPTIPVDASSTAPQK